MRSIKPDEIVAFLQNPWFPAGTAERHILHYRDDQDFHQRLLLDTMTGKRLEKSWGEEWFEAIHWDNANWRTAWMPDGRQKYDIQWMESVLEARKPRLILCYGREAEQGMDALERERQAHWARVMACHHPNARGKMQADLNKFADEAKQYQVEEA